jgi:hypothetical protein
MPKFKIYLRCQRDYYADVEIEADDYAAATEEADRLVNDWDACRRLDWEGADEYGDSEWDWIEELAPDEPEVPLPERGFGS